MHTKRNTPAVVFYANRAVKVQTNFDFFTITRQRFIGGEDIADELKGLLGRWLFSHIRSDDRNYVEAINDNLRRLSADTSEGGWLRRAGRRFFRSAA